jgi:hypothetical protein
MPILSRLLALALLGLLVVAGGCKHPEEQPQAKPAKLKKVQRIVVPASVKGRWKAVKIAVFDKETRKQEVYTVDIGSSFVVGDSKLRVKVENFLPAFLMDGKTMTSVSNETNNPAAQISISEDGKELFRGWLFSLYPATHAFQHPRYNFTLIDFIPTAGKKG